MKKKCKKIVCMMLACCLLFSVVLSGCGEKEENNAAGTDSSSKANDTAGKDESSGGRTNDDAENGESNGSKTDDASGNSESNSSKTKDTVGTSDQNNSSEEDDSIDDGLSEDVMRIGSVEDLVKFSEQVSNGNDTLNAVLTADIDMSEVCGKDGKSWIPIGYENKIEYNGAFDGDGHTIQNLYFVQDEEMHNGGGGLFWVLAEDSVICNLTLQDVDIETEHGGCIARETSGRIENCHGNGTVRGLANGGLIGYGYGESIMIGCSFSGMVEARSSGGGLACSAKRIEQCRNEATVICIVEKPAGLDGSAAGIAVSASSVKNCVNAGTVISVYSAGIVEKTSKEAVIEDCFNIGTVIGRTQAGGIGDQCLDNTVINRCGNDGTVQAGLLAAGIVSCCRNEVKNCYQKGVVEAGPEISDAVLTEAGYPEYVFKDVNYLGDSEAVGITYRSNQVVNCYSQGTITAQHIKSTYGSAAGILWYLDDCKPNKMQISNCYSTAQMNANYELWGIGKGYTNSLGSCYYSEQTAEQATNNEKMNFAPSAGSAFTDGTITAALNEWVKNAEGDYSTWKQGVDGPCFEWE